MFSKIGLKNLINNSGYRIPPYGVPLFIIILLDALFIAMWVEWYKTWIVMMRSVGKYCWAKYLNSLGQVRESKALLISIKINELKFVLLLVGYKSIEFFESIRNFRIRASVPIPFTNPN